MSEVVENEIAVVEETTAAPGLSNQFDIVDVDSAEAFMQNYQELVNRLLDKETDYQNIGGKNAKKKSAWRKLATAFNISDEIINEQLIIDETDGQIVTARYKVKATLPNGRSTIGVGVCSIYDKIRYTATKNFEADTETPSNFILRGRFSNAEHDVPSTAHTRAKNRAIADLIGAGETSAEELAEEPKQVSRKQKNSSNGTVNSAKTENKPRRGRKRRSREPLKEETIETTAKVVDTDFSNVDNEAVKTAIDRIVNAEEEPTKTNIIDELFNLYDIGNISEDEYYAAKSALGV